MKSERLPELINGWFVVAFSRDVPKGRVHVVRYMDQPVALFRTASGRLAAVDGYCPHLGASFENMGSVVGEELRCGAHDFRFDCQGSCTHAYGAPLATVHLRTWHVREQLGAIFLWYHHEDAPPTWELPTWSEPRWGRARPSSFRIRSHPQLVVENGIDRGHFEAVHGFHAPEPGHLELDGHHLTMLTSFTADARIVGRIGRAVQVSLKYEVFGLGLAMAESFVPSIDAHLRSFVASTPRGDGTVDLRCWVSVHDAKRMARRVPAVGRVLPGFVAGPVMERLVHRVFLYDFRKHVRDLDHRRHLTPAGLSRHDAHLAPYREWAKQFYPPIPERVSLPVLVA